MAPSTLATPLPQAKHFDPAMGLNVPARQSSHPVDPLRLHAHELDQTMRPAWSAGSSYLDEPAGHGTQPDPTEGLYVPSWHGMQLPAPPVSVPTTLINYTT